MKNSINFKNIKPVKKAFLDQAVQDLNEYDMLQNLKGKVAKLEQEKDSLVKLANNRFDEIENLKAENEKLDHENINYRIRIDKMVNSDKITQSNLGESLRDNEKLESEIKDLKTHLRLIAKLSDYESLGYKL